MRRFYVFLAISLLAASTLAADEPLRLALRDHRFIPDRLEMPAHVKVRLLVKNDGDQTIEWESDELDREEVIEPGEERAIFLGPLDPGSYPFYDDRHSSTKGTLIVK